MIEIFKKFFSIIIDAISISISENQTIQSLAIKSNKEIKKLVNIITMRIIGVLLITLSISHSYFFLAERYDSNQPFQLGLVGRSGITLFLLGILSIAYSLKEKNNMTLLHTIEQAEVANESNDTHPPILEQAIAALIFDFIKERELKRENEKQEKLVINKKNKTTEDELILQ